MNDKQFADILCRALLAIVSALRKKYDLPTYKEITIQIVEYDGENVAGVVGYTE